MPGRKKLAVEDFAQLSGMSRETKYNSSMEKVAGIIEKVGTQHQNSFLDLSELQESLTHFIKSDDIDYPEAQQADTYDYAETHTSAVPARIKNSALVHK